MGSIRIRLAEPEDNDQIQALGRRCYQEGVINVAVHRSPTFNTMHRLLDPDAWHMVAEDDGVIVGLIGLVHFRSRLAGESRRLGYMMDLRLDEAYRKGTTAFKLLKKAIDTSLGMGTDLVIGNFLKSNQNSLIITQGRAGIPKSLYLGDNRVFNMIPVRRMRTDPAFEIRRATEADLPDMVALYESYEKNFRMAPQITEEVLKRYLQLEGLSIDSFWIARERGGRERGGQDQGGQDQGSRDWRSRSAVGKQGPLRAVVAAWDEHTYKHYQVLKLSRNIRIVNGALAALSPFLKIPKPIRLNEPLPQMSLVLYAHDRSPHALVSLFRHINNEYRGTRYTLISFYAQEKDPIFDAMSGFASVSVQSEMYLFAEDPSIYAPITRDERPAWLDLALTL